MIKYLLNGFLLIIPILIWNIIFTKSLPRSYFLNVSDKIEVFEYIFRILAFTIPLIMKISFETKIQKIGLGIYVSGVGLYFASWLLQIYLPNSRWSLSVYGFMAPAYTTFIWFSGIALIAKQSYFKFSHISLTYFVIATLFVVFHSIHTYNIFRHIN
jgi:hypothetical protein